MADRKGSKTKAGSSKPARPGQTKAKPNKTQRKGAPTNSTPNRGRGFSQGGGESRVIT